MRFDKERLREATHVVELEDATIVRPEGVRFAKGFVCGLAIALSLWALPVAVCWWMR